MGAIALALVRDEGTLRAISETSLVSHPSVSAKVAASVSLPNRKSTYGSVSVSTCLNGGTCGRGKFH